MDIEVFKQARFFEYGIVAKIRARVLKTYLKILYAIFLLVHFEIINTTTKLVNSCLISLHLSFVVLEICHIRLIVTTVVTGYITPKISFYIDYLNRQAGSRLMPHNWNTPIKKNDKFIKWMEEQMN